MCVALALSIVATRAPAAGGITLNFTNADIDTVIKSVGEYTGRTFIIDPRVKGTINIVSAKPVPRSAIYPALLAALRMAGFAVVESGGTTKILPEIEAKTYGVGQGSPTGTVLTTRVIPLQHESATQMVNVVRPLIAPNNTVTAYAPANALIITDYADNLSRIEQLIQTLDQPARASGGTTEPALVVMKHAHAPDVAQLLRNVFTDPVPAQNADPRDRVLITADARLNALVIRADNPSRLARALALARELDQVPQASAHGTGNVHIIRLRNANATDLALTLRKVLGAEGATASPPAAAPAPNLSALLSSASASSANVPTAQVNAAVTPPNPTPVSQVSFSAGQATIFADAANNTLIINAPEHVARNVRAVVEQLDVRRAQVYVEALIVELSAEKAAEFGVQWQALSGVNNGNFRFVGGTNVANPNAIGATANNAFGLVGAIGQSTTQSRGLAVGALREITIPGIGTVYSLAALAKALEKDAKGNVLSMPTLLTLDNEEAKFSAGQNLPFITGQYAVTGSTATPTPFQTIERRDVGLTLRVKPQIIEGGTIRMAIYQEVSNVVDLAASGAGPITNKRALDTQVLVEDGQLIALGGLLQDALTDGEDRVPVLGSVPVLGNLFKFDARKRTKTSLMLFLRPTIVRTAAQSNALSQDRYEQLLADPMASPPAPTWFWPDATAPKPALPPASAPQ